MLEWLKRKAAEKQERNIRDTLAKLIQVSNETVATIAGLGDPFPQQRKAIHKLQKRLATDFIGPMPLVEIKQHILDPALQAPGVTEGAQRAVDHVYDSVVRARHGWTRVKEGGMGWFSTTESDPTKLRAVFDRVWPIIVAYSEVVGARSEEPPPHSMSALPDPKSAIADALLEWLTLLAKPDTRRTIASNWPEMLDELASPEVVESLIVQYLLLPYYIPDRDAQIMHKVAKGQVDGLAVYEVERFSAIRMAMMAERGERESMLKRLGYSTRGE